jgi:hypothetical protein
MEYSPPEIVTDAFAVMPEIVTSLEVTGVESATSDWLVNAKAFGVVSGPGGGCGPESEPEPPPPHPASMTKRPIVATNDFRSDMRTAP